MSKIRSKRISAHKTMDYASGQAIWLGQWHYSQRKADRFGESICYSFKSIVTRPGKFGLYLDKPYYCFAGEHQYRRLPIGLSAYVLLCVVRGYTHDHLFRIKERARYLVMDMERRIKAIPDSYRNQKARRAFDKLLDL